MPAIEILSPADNTVFDIAPGTAATGAQMPVIRAEARVTGVTPDSTPTAIFTWTVSIKFQCSDCTNGKTREINDEFRLTTHGGVCAIHFPRVRGGLLTISAAVNLPSGCFEKGTKGLRIRGINPPRQEVNRACGDQWLQKMVLQESRRRQFAADPETGASNCPLFSGDRLGGVGLLQITVPKPTDDEHWNWKANIERGMQILNEKRNIARQYPAQVRASHGFQDLLRRFNAGRNPPAVIQLPDFTPVQLEMDAVRGYNGWAGRDAFGLPLHEFRVPVDAQGNLRVTINASHHGVIEWEQVPAADRPQNTGDPNYVRNVERQTP